ncbi:flagellar motor switch protein FliN [Eubacteriaceae bacterium ES3]|nr:flagellar motor switch protein FliN [Eubacteriaceae bacterium ES3]
MTAEMNPEKLTDMEIDVIGEVMNISMGSAATAMSTILGTKVNITTPRIETVGVEEFEFTYLEPVIGVLINYVEGIDGSNVLLLKEEDMKKILSQLFGMEPGDEMEFDEISKSAIGEIMNQMMGSAAGALASFLGKVVNISPPSMLDTTSKTSVRELFALKGDNLVSIKFHLIIEDLVDSEFISAMEPSLAKEIVAMSMGVSGMEEEEEVVTPPPEPPPQTPPPQQAPTPDQPPQQAPPQQAPPQGYDQAYQQPPQGYEQPYQQAPPGQYQQPYQQAPPGQYQQPYQQAPPGQYQQPYQQVPPGQYQQAPPGQYQQMPPHPSENVVSHQQPVEVSNYNYRSFDAPEDQGNLVSADNLELIMSVPIQISVELGRTQKKIKDIAELTLGNIVELDRQAGDQVDVIANGRLIARGDVVVVDDNYSVKITEIIKTKEELNNKK